MACNCGVIGPDFCCIGAQKSGTGWLYEQLRSHPDFWMPPVKELHYFDRFWRSPRQAVGGSGSESRLERARKEARDERDLVFLTAMEALFARSEIDLEGYAQLFASKASLLSGDITPGYSTLPDEIVERIAAHFTELKVLFLARDPVERAWSHLSMWVRHRRIPAFDVNDVAEVTRNLLQPEVLMRSHPSKIVARWRRYVPADRFRVYFFDDLKRDPAGLRSAIIGFLGADASKSSGELAVDHNTKAKQERLVLSETVRAHVARFFKQELMASASELGGPAAKWPARYGF
jgi:Sulfotransferase family